MINYIKQLVLLVVLQVVVLVMMMVIIDNSVKAYYVSGSYGSIGLAFFVPQQDGQCMISQCINDLECDQDCPQCTFTCGATNFLSCCKNSSLNFFQICTTDSQCCTDTCYITSHGLFTSSTCCQPNGINVSVCCPGNFPSNGCPYCCSGATTNGICACVVNGDSCFTNINQTNNGTYPDQCCTGQCVYNPGTTSPVAGLCCQNSTLCCLLSSSSPCAQDVQCCSGLCVLNTCICLIPGQPCSTNGNCCSNNCDLLLNICL